MKPRDGSIPKLDPEKRAERPVTKEIGIDDDTQPGEDIELSFDTADTWGRPHPIGVSRDRRVTLTSHIPAQLAEAMLSGGTVGHPRTGRDPAAPHPVGGHLPRRVGDDDEHH